MKKYSSHHRLVNNLQVLLLMASMLLILTVIGWLLAGKAGALWAVMTGALIFLSIPRLSPHFILLMSGGRHLSYEQAPEIHNILQTLSANAGLDNIPEIYYLPRKTLEAFSIGRKPQVAIAVSAGLIQTLNTRELTSVLAHEISHIHHNDIRVMQLAQIMNLMILLFSLFAYLTVLIYIPVIIANKEPIPWLLLIILLFAPNIGTMLQLSISRIREFDADLEAVKLTRDPAALASALQKIEYYQMNWLAQILMPHRKLRVPRLLRTHPSTKERIKRLQELASSGEFNRYY